MTFPDLIDVRALRGPNVWCRNAVLQATVGPLPSLPSVTKDYAGNLYRLISALGRHAESAVCAVEEWEISGRGSYLGRALVDLVLPFENAAGCKVKHARFTHAAGADTCLLAIDIESIEDQDIARQSLAAAHAVI